MRTSIPYHELATYRTFVRDLCRGTRRYQHLLIGQSGQVWFVKDLETGHEVEIALYRAGRAEPEATSPQILLAEIAPWGVNSLEEALPIIRKYERLLGLTRKRERLSNVELFADKYV